MTKDIDLQTTSATAIIAAFKRKDVSAVELCDAAIARIEAFDGPINAVVVRDFETARADARRTDASFSNTVNKPLAGLPMTVKESFDLVGHPTTWGFEADSYLPAQTNSRVVQLLEEAGATVLGKTNVPVALADWQSFNPVYGRTSNPHDLGRSPGGSSGGGAAAVAAGFSALEVGTDIGGSIRMPAAFCGVFGLKTTHGTISLKGHQPPGVPEGMDAPFSVAGPIARTAEDAMLAYSVLAELDPLVPASHLVPPAPAKASLSDYSVLVLSENPKARADLHVLAALEATAKAIEQGGGRVERSSELLPDLMNAHRTYQKMLQTILSRRSADAQASMSAHAFMNLQDVHVRVRQQWEKLFESFDIVLTPSFGAEAFPHTDEEDWGKRSIVIDGEGTRYGDQMGWISPATFANLPATAFPTGVGRDGLPISLQAIGGHLQDLTTLHFAGLVAAPVTPPKLSR